MSSTPSAGLGPPASLSAAPASLSTAPARITLSLRGLLGIYAIIPLCALLFLLDRVAWHGALHNKLPTDPDRLFLFGLLFGWPHILASTVILATNAEYRKAYGVRTLIACVVIIAFFGIGNFALPYIVLSVVAATATTVHVLKQQIGIGAGAGRLASWTYPAWGWTGIATGVVMYNAIYLEAEMVKYRHALDVAALGLAGVMLALTFVCHAQMKTALGRAFLWGNTLMVLGPVAFHFQNYDVFAMAIPRVIHDTTAFAFYVAHDHNKHKQSPSNALYRATRKLPGSVYWLSPALAVGLAYLLEKHGDAAFEALVGHATADKLPKFVSLGVLGFFSMVHYYTEAFTWKNGSPYRAHVSIRA